MSIVCVLITEFSKLPPGRRPRFGLLDRTAGQQAAVRLRLTSFHAIRKKLAGCGPDSLETG
jgi:hypothetical protein